MQDDPSTPDSRTLGPRTVMGVAIALLVLTRLATLGHQSPWLDEINNWLIAGETGLSWRPGLHQLTYICIYVSTRLFDNAFGLRLPSFLFGAATVLLATWWTGKSAGWRAGLFAAIVLSLSPFAIFYGKDANHYAPMMFSGVLAIFAVDRFVVEKWQPAKLAICLIAAVATLGFQLPSVFSVLTIAMGAFAYAMIFPEKLWAGAEGEKRKATRLVMLLGAMFACGVFLYLVPVFEIIQRSTGHPFNADRRIGFSATFWNPMIADLFVSLYTHRAFDTVAGYGFAMLALSGWVAQSRSGGGWIAASWAFLVIATFAFFYIFEPATPFGSKLFATFVPGALIGVALGLDAICRRFPARGGQVAAVGILCAYVGISAEWQLRHLRRDHQPATAALDWLLEETPDDAIVATRANFSQRAFGYLWERAGERTGSRTYLPLSFVNLCGAPSIAQLRAAAVTGRPIYFLSLLEPRDNEAEDFARFLSEETTVEKFFPSATLDYFAPFEYSITVRRVAPKSVGIPSLPFDGTATQSIVSEPELTGIARTGFARLFFPAYSGATYDFHAEAPTEGIALEFMTNGKAGNYRIFATLDDADSIYRATISVGADEGTIWIPAPLGAGNHRFFFYLENTNGSRAETLWRFSPIEISATKPANSIAIERFDAIAEIESNWEFPPDDGRYPGAPLPPLPAGVETIAASTFSIGGLPGRAIALGVAAEDGRRIYTVRDVRWTASESWSAATLPPDFSAGGSTALMDAYTINSDMARGSRFKIGPLRLYAPAPK